MTLLVTSCEDDRKADQKADRGDRGPASGGAVMDAVAPTAVPDPQVRVRRLHHSPSSSVDAGLDPANELLMQAQRASLSNQYGRAMMLAQQSIRHKPSARAWAVYGAAACNSSNQVAAKRAFKHLQGGMRGMLVTLCKNKGIPLP